VHQVGQLRGRMHQNPGRILTGPSGGIAADGQDDLAGTDDGNLRSRGRRAKRDQRCPLKITGLPRTPGLRQSEPAILRPARSTRRSISILRSRHAALAYKSNRLRGDVDAVVAAPTSPVPRLRARHKGRPGQSKPAVPRHRAWFVGSVDGGKQWRTTRAANLPAARCRDLAIHPRDH